MSFIDRLASRFLTQARITHKALLTDRIYHVRIQSDSFRTAAYTPGNFLRLFCGQGMNVALGDKVRSYSVWNYNRASGSIDMAVCVHSSGPGAAWVQACQPGDTIGFTWHQGNFVVDATAAHYVFVGDSSALGHLYEIRRNLPSGKKIQSILYGRDEQDFFEDIDGTMPFGFYPMPVNPIAFLTAKLGELDLKSPGLVYIGGDSRVCVALHKHFRQTFGWGTRQIKAKPFWNPEKRGLE